MAAYVVFLREGPVNDPAAVQEYQRLSRQAPANGMKPHVAYGAVTPLEGKAPETVVVLEFPTLDAARAWYDSPEYQTAAPYRIGSAEWRSFIVEGFSPPKA